MDGIDLHQTVVFGSVVVDTNSVWITGTFDFGNVFEEERGDVVIGSGFIKIVIESRSV
jgi:hypothetical protein